MDLKKINTGEMRRQVGARIRVARKGNNFSQKNLADICGVNRMYVLRLENGRAPLNIEKLIDIATAMRIHPDLIMPDQIKPTDIYATRQPSLDGSGYSVSIHINGEQT